MAYPLRNLVFEGGGVKGIAYVGAARLLEEKGVLAGIKRYGGTSAGAINALLLSLGYDPDEQQRIMEKLDFNNFKDRDWYVVSNLKRIFYQFGRYKGAFFKNWVRELIGEKLGNPDATFREMKEKGLPDLYVCGTNLNTASATVFSPDNTPEVPIAHAMRITMSIPLFFAAVKGGKQQRDWLVDGGVLNNYPLWLFDNETFLEDKSLQKKVAEKKLVATSGNRPEGYHKGKTRFWNPETLGFRLDSKEQIENFQEGGEPPRVEIDNVMDYGKALLGTMMAAQDIQHLLADDSLRTVYIDSVEVGTTDFDLSGEKKKALIDSGAKWSKNFFDWYGGNPGELP